MLIYVIVFTLTTLLGGVIDNYQNKKLKSTSNKKTVKYLYMILFFIFVFFVGLRDVSVGSDSAVYEYKFNIAGEMGLVDFLADNLFSDPGYYVFAWSLKHVIGNINLYFFIISCIFFSTYLKFISKYSSSVFWSIWLLNSLGFTTFALSTLRQCLAMSFCLIAYMLWQDKKKISWLFMFIAVTFHSTSIVFLPMMFIGLFINKQLLWKLALIIGVTVLIAPSVMGYMTLNIEDGFYETTQVGGVGMIILLVLLLIMGLFAYFPRRSNIPITNYYEYTAVGLALCSFLVTRFNLAAMRLFWYYLSFSILLIPNALNKIKPSVRTSIAAGLFVITFYYLFARVMDDPYAESRLLLPYKFFWE